MIPNYNDVTLPEFGRVIYKVQRQDGPTAVANDGRGRKFVASGPKADAVAKILVMAMISGGSVTRKGIVALTGASASRVSEVVWVMSTNLDHNFNAYFVR